MKDILIILGFWAMVFAPCIVALNTGAHREPQNSRDS